MLKLAVGCRGEKQFAFDVEGAEDIIIKQLCLFKLDKDKYRNRDPQLGSPEALVLVELF